MNFQWKPRKYLITTLRVIGWICFSIVGLLVLISLAIQIPYVQNKLTQKAITFLENKIGTDVNLEHISLSIPKTLVLSGLYLEDQNATHSYMQENWPSTQIFGNLLSIPSN